MQGKLLEKEHMKIKCPNCKNIGADRYQGNIDYGYICVSCGHIFSLNDLYNVKDNKIRRMKKLYEAGLGCRYIPIVLNLENPTSSQVDYLKVLRSMEVEIENDQPLTSEKKEFIKKWGVGMAIPAEYLAPYVPCSIRRCEEELSKHKIPKRKEIVLSEKDRAFDKMLLDKFIS